MQNRKDPLETAQIIADALANHKRHAKAEQDLQNLHSRRGNLAYEILVSALPDYERVNLLDKAIDITTTEQNTALQTIKEELRI